MALQRQLMPMLRQNARSHVFAPAFINQRRTVSTAPMSASQNLDLLKAQRKLRPNSPHFTIYEPQLTWLSSIANRVTGSGLSAGFYAFSIAYLLGPAVGLPFDSASVVDTWAALPEWVKYSGKAIVAGPFMFHTWNGLRHLAWDMGKVLTLKSSYAAGYAVLGLTAVTTVWAVIV